MSKKISLIVTIFTVILSIALVTFFGLKAQDIPKTVRVQEVMFVTEKGGNEAQKYKRTVMPFEKGTETFEIYYFIAPADASNKEISITCDDYDEHSNIECRKSLSQEGVIDVDLKGSALNQFSIRITSLDNTFASAIIVLRVAQ